MRENDVVMDEWDLSQRTPVEWDDILEGYSRERQTAGQSEAAVFRLERQDKPTLFIKIEPVSSFSELPGEAARLRWLTENAVPCPQILAETQDEARHWVLMTGLPGRDLSSMQGFAPGRIVEIAATALRDLHQLDATQCPFDHTLDRRLELASRRVVAGLVDEEDFDEDRLGRGASDLFDELVRNRPLDEDLVVSHGDATFANLIVNGSKFSGFIDCARLGVADRHQDLALMVREIRHNLGEEWAELLLRHYDRSVDRQKLAFYQFLDEFF